jgi:hypothetical protein
MLNAPPNWPFTLPTAGEEDNPSSAQDSSQYFDGKYSDAVPQRLGDIDKHRWLDARDLGTWNQGNRNGSIAPGLGAGQTVSYEFDQRAEFYIVSVDGESDANIRVYLGPGGGEFFRIGQGGKVKLPAQSTMLTISNTGSGTAFGTVVAVRGFPNFDVDYTATSAPSVKGTSTTFAVVSVPTGGAQVLAANVKRKSALFQNLGANQITLGKGAAPASGSGILLSGTGNPTFNDTSTIDAWYGTAATGATNLLVMEIA